MTALVLWGCDACGYKGGLEFVNGILRCPVCFVSEKTIGGDAGKRHAEFRKWMRCMEKLGDTKFEVWKNCLFKAGDDRKKATELLIKAVEEFS